MIAKSKTSTQIMRDTHDVDGAERAFFGTDAAANAETFGYVGNLGFSRYLYTEAAAANNLRSRQRHEPASVTG
jgi:hypothetical protein